MPHADKDGGSVCVRVIFLFLLLLNRRGQGRQTACGIHKLSSLPSEPELLQILRLQMTCGIPGVTVLGGREVSLCHNKKASL